MILLLMSLLFRVMVWISASGVKVGDAEVADSAAFTDLQPFAENVPNFFSLLIRLLRRGYLGGRGHPRDSIGVLITTRSSRGLTHGNSKGVGTGVCVEPLLFEPGAEHKKDHGLATVLLFSVEFDAARMLNSFNAVLLWTKCIK